MGQPNYSRCKGCGRHRDECGTLSWTRLCADCGLENMNENIDGLHDKTGVPWQRWRQAMAACVGAQLPGLSLDDPRGGT